MDGLVQLGEAEEAAIAQAGQDPALDDLDADFDFRLVPRFARPRRHDRGVVMGRHAGIGAVDLGIVQAGLDDAGLEVVRHHVRRHAAEDRRRRGLCEPIQSGSACVQVASPLVV